MSIKNPIRFKTIKNDQSKRIVLVDHLFKLGIENKVEPTHLYEIFDMGETDSDSPKYGNYLGQFIFTDTYDEWTFKEYEIFALDEQLQIVEFIQLNKYTS